MKAKGAFAILVGIFSLHKFPYGNQESSIQEAKAPSINGTGSI